ncbi:MAG: DNA-binding protein [Alphaproteobacteria bacterium]|nr:DNA-binding protein [Alphaproteobacteria bacterium]
MAVAIAENLLTDGPDGPCLIGGRDPETGEIVFPLPRGPLAARFKTHPLKREGTLWSFTVQRFPPKPPFIGATSPFKPYAVGYVELPGEIIVETRIKTENFAALKIGMAMKLTRETFAQRDGEDVYTYAFEPA